MSGIFGDFDKTFRGMIPVREIFKDYNIQWHGDMRRESCRCPNCKKTFTLYSDDGLEDLILTLDPSITETSESMYIPNEMYDNIKAILDNDGLRKGARR
jgi:hypothetical protein